VRTRVDVDEYGAAAANRHQLDRLPVHRHRKPR
jgi:hypothetical protein